MSGFSIKDGNKPPWLKTTLPKEAEFFRLRSLLHKYGLNTVCESASCPNIGKCWDSGTLTIMILGDTCSRACRFCDVPTGSLKPIDWDEPYNVADMLGYLNLKYVVITSVDRDDLEDGGSSIWAQTITKIRQKKPELKIEALIPDFKGEEKLIANVCTAKPDILSHNIETVFSLQKSIRPQCDYQWSLKTLSLASKKFHLPTKSGLMLGHGEKKDEVIQTMKDLLDTGCQILTLGQYLQPSLSHAKVVNYIHPDVFQEYKEIGVSMGFLHVESGPLIRSSYLADRQAQLAGI